MDPGLAVDFAGLAFYQQLALIAADRIAGCSTHLKLLHMDILISICAPWLAEPELENNLFACIAIQVETEDIQTLLMESIWRREAHIRIDRHRHNGGVGPALKEIKVTHIEARIFLGKFGVEVMGHTLPRR
jgi:hypothetical protein